MAIKLTLPFPPSVNGYWRAPNKGKFAGKHLISERGRQYRIDTIRSVLSQLKNHKALSVDVCVNIVLNPPDKRIRDLDNYPKALFDALTHAHVWNDDSQVKKMTVQWGNIVKNGLLDITIEEMKWES